MRPATGAWCVVLCLLSACARLDLDASPWAPVIEEAALDPDDTVHGRIPDDEAVTPDGRKVALYTDVARGAAVVIHFACSSCARPPDGTALLSGRLRAVALASAHDDRISAQDLPGWQFLRLAPEDLRRLRMRLGMQPRSEELVVLDDRSGSWTRVPLDVTAEHLRDALAAFDVTRASVDPGRAVSIRASSPVVDSRPEPTRGGITNSN